METDGRIRSKDIGTGEVNSRVIDDLRSSNYDGSRTDPENDPGLTGWQILKSGFVVINDAIVRGTIAAARIVSAVLESGTLNIRSGGSITVGGDAETGVAPLVTLDETGLEIGDDVVIDSTGLFVDGGHTQAVWGFVDEATTNSPTLGSTVITSSATNIHQIVINPPDWVEQLYVAIVGDMLVGNSTGAPHRMDTRVIADDGGASEAASTMSQEKEATGISRSVTVSQNLAIPLSPAGRSVTITQRATLSGGSSASGRVRLNVMALGVRTAFT